ncbi:MAG: hypothetical protein WEC75_07240 [Dehalococcoidia bacterium]
MTFSARTSVSDLPRGHEFPSTSFTLSAEQISAYLAAVGDTIDYGDSVPPLAAVALGLRELQEHLSLPDGALHTGQEVEHAGLLRVGVPLTLTGRVAQRSERQGMVISVIEFDVTAGGGAVHARTTIMAPAARA